MSDHALGHCEGLLNAANRAALEMTGVDGSLTGLLEDYEYALEKAQDECDKAQEIKDDILDDWFNPFSLAADTWDIGLHTAACFFWKNVRDGAFSDVSLLQEAVDELEKEYQSHLAGYAKCLIDHSQFDT